jgi:excinuclease ABC subunit A
VQLLGLGGEGDGPASSRNDREAIGRKWEYDRGVYYKMLLRGLAKHYKIDLETPWNKLPEKVQTELLHGAGEEIEFTYWRKNAWRKMSKKFEGVIPNLERLYEETDSEFTKSRLQNYMIGLPCPDCKGARLRKESLGVTVGDKSIIDVARLSITGAIEFFGKLQLTDHELHIADQILREVRSRLGFMQNVGLGYLTLDRQSDTLSGGEAQRIRLATQIGAGLVGVLYVLDEPSIGLHQRDNARLLDTLKGLRDLGNTVLVVEHDEDTIRQADYIVDLGPGAGVHGGHIVAAGNLAAERLRIPALPTCAACGRAAPARRPAGQVVRAGAGHEP